MADRGLVKVGHGGGLEEDGMKVGKRVYLTVYCMCSKILIIVLGQKYILLYG